MTDTLNVSSKVDQYAVSLQRTYELRARTEKTASLIESMDLDDASALRTNLSKLITIQRILRGLQEDSVRLLAGCAWGRPSDFDGRPVADTGHLTTEAVDADVLYQELRELVRLQKATRQLARQVQSEGLASLIEQDAVNTVDSRKPSP